MNNNGRINLNRVFDFNKLSVEDNALSSLQNQITSTVNNALNASEIITTIFDSLTNFQTSLSASDITLVTGQMTTKCDTLDSKYDALVIGLTSEQTNLETQIKSLSSTQQNVFSPSSSNTSSAIQTSTNGLSVTLLHIYTTIGSTSANTLTINASSEFKNGLVVSSGTVVFPSHSIDASGIANLPADISLSTQNAWKALQVYNYDISSNGLSTTGTFNHYGNSTIELHPVMH